MPASKKEAKEFVKRWQKRLAAIPAGSNNEQQDTQKFWVDLLINVLGIPSNTIDSFVDFERKVRGRRIDVFVSDHNFLCEQKSWGIDLDKPEPRNGGMETPLQQAMWYARHLPYSERPRWVMTATSGPSAFTTSTTSGPRIPCRSSPSKSSRTACTFCPS
ncbi:MAG: type IIL restriction-modification enzyme MmeI [Collinsella sp.]